MYSFDFWFVSWFIYNDLLSFMPLNLTQLSEISKYFDE
jgi:hypothetical protein